MSTDNALNSLVFTFTSGNVTAVGGSFVGTTFPKSPRISQHPRAGPAESRTPPNGGKQRRRESASALPLAHSTSFRMPVTLPSMNAVDMPEVCPIRGPGGLDVPHDPPCSWTAEVLPCRPVWAEAEPFGGSPPRVGVQTFLSVRLPVSADHVVHGGWVSRNEVLRPQQQRGSALPIACLYSQQG